jgi:hypothetical protein
MIPESLGKTNSNESDAEKLARLLEIELIQKRASWKQAGERNQRFRTFSFLFLFVLIVGCIIGFFFAFSRVNQERTNQRPAPTSAVQDR